MPKQNTHGSSLEPKLRALNDQLSSLSINEEIFNIIHRPGWTTLAELAFVTILIDNIGTTCQLLASQLKGLHDGSDLIK